MTPTYPGGKNGSGVYQAIINIIPPHRVYVEPFLGAGAVFRRKLPAVRSILIDRNPAVIAAFQHDPGNRFVGDALTLLPALRYPLDREDTFIYCDPPYLHSTRTRSDYYAYELTDADHERLLQILLSFTKARIAISGYYSDLYASALQGWTLHTFNARTHRSTKREHLWYNYPPPNRLHDYRYLGDDYHARERIRRKAVRWLQKLDQLPPLERRALLYYLNERDQP